MDGPERITSLPLDGIRVIDLVQGPLQSVGKMLADLGAEVVLVEPVSGSPARRRGEMRRGESLDFAIANRGKRSIVADVATDEGRRILDSLLRKADLCLVDSAGAVGDVTDPLRLRERHSGLAVVSMTEFGRTGPQRAWTATPDVHAALSTALSRSGLPSITQPLLPPEFLAYGAVAAQALFAALAALYQSIAEGAGDTVDLSVSEALMHVLDPVFGIGGTARGGRSMWDLPPGRPDASHMYPVFSALDGWVRICVLSPRQWAGMFEWMGRPERFADERYASTHTRYAEADALHPHIARLFAGITRAEAVELGHSFGVPIAALLSPAEVLSTGHYREAGSIGGFRFADRTIAAPTGVFDLDGTHVDASRPAPGLDEARGLADRQRSRPRWNLPPVRERPLAGLRVLDLGVIVVGGELGRLFADLGAEVIKIESRAFPDGSRLAGDMSESFAWGHRNKLSMGIDLRSEGGRAVFSDLVRRSDIVLTNFKPGTLQKLGFGYDVLSSLNPRIILSESSAFGNTGPWSTRMGYGPLVRASAGLSLLWQYPEVEGSFSDAVTIYPDHAVARLNAAAIIALLLRRGRTGRGGSVSTAQVDAILDAMSVPIALESLEPGSVSARGNAREVDAPRGVFRTAGDDEWTVIDVQGDAVFAALADVIGRPEWAINPGYATAAGRLAGGDDIRAGVESWTRSRSAADVARRLQQAGVPAGDMRRPQDLLSDAHLAERVALGSLHQPQLSRILPAFTGEASFSAIPLPPMRPAPSRGEHTAEIAENLLGWDADRIRAAVSAGVLEAASPDASAEAQTIDRGLPERASRVNAASPRKESPMTSIVTNPAPVPVRGGGAVLAEQHGHVLLVTINRPEARNAVNVDVTQGVGDALEFAEREPDVRAVILTGAGHLSFCAGQDLKEAAAGISLTDPTERRWGFAGYVRHAVSTPTIAAVNGFALGGGTEIVLASDLAVAADTATFGLPEVKRGIIPGAGGAFRLPRQVPRKLAMEMLLTGDQIDAGRAHELGLINRVVPAERLLDEAFALADAIMRNAPLAVQAAKRVSREIDDGVYSGEDADWERSAREAALVMKTDDAREGMTAFAQKRTPTWNGR